MEVAAEQGPAVVRCTSRVEAGVAERDLQVGHGHPPVPADIDAPEQRDPHDPTVVSVMDGGALGNTAA